MTKVKDLTVDEFKTLIEETVEQKLLELVSDPDQGLEMRKEVIARLKRGTAREQRGNKAISARDAAKKLGLDW
ncbi:MAG TPA: hypothetical protein VIL47_06915 [Candidatus Bipolaricaulota bacterium]